MCQNAEVHGGAGRGFGLRKVNPYLILVKAELLLLPGKGYLIGKT